MRLDITGQHEVFISQKHHYFSFDTYFILSEHSKPEPMLWPRDVTKDAGAFHLWKRLPPGNMSGNQSPAMESSSLKHCPWSCNMATKWVIISESQTCSRTKSARPQEIHCPLTSAQSLVLEGQSYQPQRSLQQHDFFDYINTCLGPSCSD